MLLYNNSNSFEPAHLIFHSQIEDVERKIPVDFDIKFQMVKGHTDMFNLYLVLTQ